MKQPFITNPFLPEGAVFWGDLPPFSPTKAPCGILFQQYKGQHGHHLNATDFSKSDQDLLLNRIANSDISTPILMNKNPYNSVRISWLKSMFPESKIYAVIRDPVANIYSLLKKYIEHKHQGLGPENGWWGIKPKNWQLLTHNDKIIQSTNQWLAVNNQVFENADQVDYFLNYESICERPNQLISLIMDEFNIQGESVSLPVCKSFNHEYTQGSRLLSKNYELRKTDTFNLSQLDESTELSPLSEHEVAYIINKTQKLWDILKQQHSF